MIGFIFVHGTFAKKADWPTLSAKLVTVAEELGEAPLFESVSWTGDNTILARQDAAGEILDKLNHILKSAQAPNSEYIDVSKCKVFVIAHSHGGSAVAYLLKQFPWVADQIAGCVFLSTPFIAIRPRPLAARVAGALIVFPAITLYALLARAIGLSDNLFSFLLETSWLEFLLLISPFYLFGLFPLLVSRSTENASILVHRQTVDIPSINSLILRFSGDEAAAGLSFVQFLSLLSTKLSSLLHILLNPPIVPPVCRVLVGQLVAPFFVVSTFTVALTLLPFFREHGMLAPYEAYAALYHAHGGIGGTVVFVFLLIVVLVSPLLVLFLATILGVFVIQAIVSKAFGWTGFVEGFAVDIAVEPVPSGNRSFANLDWAIKHGEGAVNLVHSWGYSHPLALEQMAQFVRSSAEKR